MNFLAKQFFIMKYCLIGKDARRLATALYNDRVSTNACKIQLKRLQTPLSQETLYFRIFPPKDFLLLLLKPAMCVNLL